MAIQLAHREKIGALIHIDLPASKSISNRLLVLKHLYAPKLSLDNLSDARDTLILKNLLEQFPKEINIEDAGTACRFMLAVLSITPGTWRLTGTTRMQQRPLKQLIDALRTLGASITCEEQEGFLPLSIEGRILTGGGISIHSPESSQFVSALMMIAPLMKQGLKIQVEGTFLSESYTHMTDVLMQQLGLSISHKGRSIDIAHLEHPLTLTDTVSIESDWSAAIYFYCLNALTDGDAYVLKGLKPGSSQGDSYELQKWPGTQSWNRGDLLLQHIRLPEQTVINCSDIPDLALPLIVAKAIQKQRVLFTGLETLAVKESNRTEAIAAELSKVNVSFMHSAEGWMLDASAFKFTEGLSFDTYHDHRMAMSLSLLAVCGPITIRDEQVVKKSFPAYWQQLEKLNFAIQSV